VEGGGAFCILSSPVRAGAACHDVVEVEHFFAAFEEVDLLLRPPGDLSLTPMSRI